MLNVLNRLQELTQSFQGIKLTLQGDQQRIRSCHGVHCQQTQGGWAVDDDIIETAVQMRQQLLQCHFPLFRVQHLDVKSDQFDTRGYDLEQRYFAVNHNAVNRSLSDQAVV